MSNCENCGKRFNFFNWEHKCYCCGKKMCSDCLIDIEEIPSPFDIFYLIISQKIKGKEKDNFCHYFSGDDFGTGEEIKFCSNCIKEMEEIKKKCHKYNEIKIFSKNYKGKIPLLTNKEKPNVTTPFFRDKENAELYLRIFATFNKYDILYNFEYLKEAQQKGNYIYNRWSAQAIAASTQEE